MGECGCYGSAGTFRLHGPNDGWYRVVLSPRCDYCGTGSTIDIEWCPSDGLYDPEWDESLDLRPPPLNSVTFACGPSCDEINKAARKSLVGFMPSNGNGCDEIDAEQAAEAFFVDLPQVPGLIPRQDRIGGAARTGGKG